MNSLSLMDLIGLAMYAMPDLFFHHLVNFFDFNDEIEPPVDVVIVNELDGEINTNPSV